MQYIISTTIDDPSEARRRIKGIVPHSGGYSLSMHSTLDKKFVYEGPELGEATLKQFGCNNTGFNGFTRAPKPREFEVSGLSFI